MGEAGHYVAEEVSSYTSPITSTSHKRFRPDMKEFMSGRNVVRRFDPQFLMFIERALLLPRTSG